MSKLHFVTFSLFLVIESARSLPPSVSRRQFTGLDSKTDRFVSPVFPKETTPDSVDRMSEKCLKAFSGLDAFSVFQYIDAIGKPPSGLTAGNVLWLGSYDVCKNISDAQYCLAFGVDYEITAMQSLPISWGLCAPLACNETDIPLFVNELIEVFLPTLRIKWGKYSSLHCAHPSKWTTGPIITLVICGIIAYLCLVGTLVDLCLIQQTWKFWFTLENVRNESHLPSKERQDWGDANNEYTPLVHSNVPDSKSELVSDVHLIQPSVQERGFFVRFLLCFSITRNTSKIMDCSVPPGAITSVNGVRVLSLWWIILGHTYSAIVTSGILNDILLGLNIIHRFTFGTISNAFFAVDSFFVLSGLLVAYLSFRRMEQNDGKLPLFKFYFHRFWRLTPSYMFVILFYSNLYAFLGEGPYWFSSQNSTLCEKYWWTNLLYVNNFYPTNSGNQCLGWSWYLANDMQFYIISPLVIFLVKRFKWKGVFASVGGLLGISFVVTAVIIDYYELKVILFGRGGGEPDLKQNGAENNFSDVLYIKPYCRISTYLVGMVLGYLIHAEESAPRLSPLRKIPRQIVCLVGWFVATGLGVTVVYGIYPSTKKGGTPFNKAENITYGTFSRFTWGLALAWVIYACNKGYGSLVNKFLSASYWIPLSRLTYSAYLLHVIVLQAFFASFHHTTEYTDELWAFYFVAGVAMTYAAAFVLTVCVEFPVMQLENTFFFRNKK